MGAYFPAQFFNFSHRHGKALICLILLNDEISSYLLLFLYSDGLLNAKTIMIGMQSFTMSLQLCLLLNLFLNIKILSKYWIRGVAAVKKVIRATFYCIFRTIFRRNEAFTLTTFFRTVLHKVIYKNGPAFSGLISFFYLYSLRTWCDDE